MANTALEFLASKFQNVVRYDEYGNPSWFVKIPKVNSKWLSDDLPDHVHPAFKIKGKEYDYILIGKYKSCCITGSDVAYSIPAAAPLVNQGFDELLRRVRLFGGGASSKTVADSGLILLLARKLGWKQPKGNNSYGVDYRDATRFELAKEVKVNDVRAFQGWTYKCLKGHTTNKDLLPDTHPDYWQRLEHVGGIMVAGQQNDANWYNGYNTLTGSGPVSWNLPDDETGITDLNGNCFDQDAGFRVKDGELQIMADNDAAAPDADLSANSAAWRAILPSTSDDSFSLVTPGSAGTLKWDYSAETGGTVTLDTQITHRCTEVSWPKFTTLKAAAERVPYVPYILKELGIMPCTGDTTTEGTCGYDNRVGEFLPRRGGHYGSASNAGLGHVLCSNVRSFAIAGYGVRSRFIDNL